nr:hypothetical protein [Neobacillus sp. Marseille-Q6967]
MSFMKPMKDKTSKETKQYVLHTNNPKTKRKRKPKKNVLHPAATKDQP